MVSASLATAGRDICCGVLGKWTILPLVVLIELCSSSTLRAFQKVVLLLALSFRSFNLTSICAFGLLAYVGYILDAFPSLFDLHRNNGSLLVSFYPSKFVLHCNVCQLNNSEHTLPAGLLQPLSVPLQPGSSISMDFLEALPKSYGYSSILVVVDRFTGSFHSSISPF
jgi:hypothetical protein